jgi:dsDNA-specific endonuclease/ATPase MutS2
MDKLVLSVEASKFLQLKQQLASAYPTADEETLLDTLEGITDLHEMIAAVIRSALVDEALQTGLRTRLDEMRLRLTRLEERGA